MHDLDADRACVGCGSPTPRREMFGVEPDLRCPPCADALRHRTSPAQVRARPASFRPPTGRPEGRVAIAVAVGLGVLFLARMVPGPLADLLQRVLYDNLTVRTLGPVEEPTGFRLGGHPEPWQLVGWALLHGGVLHVLLNALALVQVGRWVEWGWGARTLLFVLLGAGVAGVAAGWLVNGRVTIGISGGLFALDGWLLAQRRHHVVASALVNRVFVHSLIVSALIMVVLTETGAYPVSHVGHAAGFLWGLCAGFAARGRGRVAGFAALSLLTLALVLLPHFVEPLGLRVTLFGAGT